MLERLSVTMSSSESLDFETHDSSFESSSSSETECEYSASEWTADTDTVVEGEGQSGSVVFESRKVYAGAQVTYLECLSLLLRFCLVHALTKRAFEDLLRLIAFFLPSAAKGVLPTSVYLMKRAFVNTFPHVPGRRVCYCSTCHAILDVRTTCGKDTCFGGIKDFVYVSVAEQLKLKLEGKAV